MIHRGDLTMNESIFLKINEETQLKYLSLNDAHELFNLIEKNRNYLRQWLPWLDHNKTLEDSTSYIQKSILGYQAKDELSLAIIYNKNIVGTISFNSINDSLKLAIIGYWLDKDHQGKGIMTNSCKQLISYGFENLKLEKIKIACATKNTPSNAIAKKLHFKLQEMKIKNEWLYDHFEDTNIYIMTKEDWQNIVL